MSLGIIGGQSQPQTGAQILSRLKAVAGEGSGLDADTVRGQPPPYGEQVVPGLPSGIPLNGGMPFRNSYVNALFRN